jgi:hypothetical protein
VSERLPGFSRGKQDSTSGFKVYRKRTPMPTNQQHANPKDLEQNKREALTALIGEQVIHALGEPGDLHQVQVRPLWADHYRVNVLRGADAASVKVAHSYFLEADGDGNILASNPQITRRY